MHKSKHRRQFADSLILLMICAAVLETGFLMHPGKCLALAKQAPENQINFYIEKYHLADPQDNPLVKRSYEIFNRVRAVADKRGTHFPKLKIVKSAKEPWAIALPDGHIVLSMGAVKICYGNTLSETGDARMAFVLGHELGHMAENDFWHLETYRALAGDPEHAWIKETLKKSNIDTNGRDKKIVERLEVIRTKETRADDRGLMYAGIAGFAVDTLVTPKDGRADFFTEWVGQIPHNIKDDKHPRPQDRAKFLQSRLKNLADSLDLFKYGVRLAQFEKYDEAIYFFREFQKVFPSREVFNNVGYCLLQRAVGELPPDVAYHYWMPTTLDLRSRAEKFSLRGTNNGQEGLSPEVVSMLEEAAAYFEQACDKDAHYWPCRLNLATTYFYLNRIYEARARIEQALRLAPDLEEARIIKALILLREDPTIDMWPTSIQMLEKMVAQNENNLCALYNLTILFDDRGRSGKATKLWNRLISKAEQLPIPIRKAVLKRATTSPAAKAPGSSAIELPWKQPIKIGTDFYEDESAKKIIAGWKQTPFDWFNEELKGRILKRGDGIGALDFDGIVEMVVLAGEGLGTMDDLSKRYGLPMHTRKINGGRLVQYNHKWCALVMDGRIKEIWIARE